MSGINRTWAPSHPATIIVVAVLLLSGCTRPAETSPEETQTTGRDPPRLLDESTKVHFADGRPAPASSFGLELPRFEQRNLSLVSAAEPSVSVTPSGAAFSLSWTSGRADLWRTRDAGRSWTLVTPTAPPQSNDPLVYADPVTGRLFFMNLGATFDANCVHIQWSDDDGSTWKRSDVNDCTPNPAAAPFDHPSISSGPANATTSAERVTYVCGKYPSKDIDCSRSLDGGATWGPLISTGMGDCFFGLASTSERGTVYIPQACGEARVAVSHDTGLSWEIQAVHPYAPRTTGSFDGGPIQPAVAADAEGNAYFLFIDANNLPAVSTSPDAGKTWSAPINISRPGLTAANRPSIVAGAEGRIAFMYLGTESPGGVDATDATQWNMYVGFGVNVLGDSPVFATTLANAADDPVKIGQCIGRCATTPAPPLGPNIGMGEFVRMAVDPTTGYVYAPFVDLCDGACASGAPAPSTAIAALGVQLGGPSLFD